MVPSDVGVQVTLLGTLEVTVGTHVWLLSCVGVDVFLQGHLLCCPEGAVSTRIRTLSCVDPDVCLEVTEAPADLSAVWTHETRESVPREGPHEEVL